MSTASFVYQLRSEQLQVVDGENQIKVPQSSPDFDVVRGYVPVGLLKKFKFYCVERGIDNSKPTFRRLLVESEGFFEREPNCNLLKSSC
jgi:hypothetical protein